MELLGIGPFELIFILIIALIVLGPNDMVKAGRTLGRWMRTIVTSPTWRTIQQTSREIRYLPNRLIREAGLEEQISEIRTGLPGKGQLRRDLGLDQINSDLKQWERDISDWTTPSPTIGTPRETPDAPPVEDLPEPSDNTSGQTPPDTGPQTPIEQG
jgi:hypothetical protein